MSQNDSVVYIVMGCYIKNSYYCLYKITKLMSEKNYLRSNTRQSELSYVAIVAVELIKYFDFNYVIHKIAARK